MARSELGRHVAARIQRVDGEVIVVLHNTRSGDVATIGWREWELLSAADGTRDIEGIVRAARFRGAAAKREHLEPFLSALGQGGWLDASGSEPAASATVSRPLEVLADFALSCDGSGSCCRLYPTTLFSPLEAARARAFVPEVMSAGEDEARGFCRERGTGQPGALAVAMDDGRCAYLADDRRCRIHEAGGAGAKPRGCQLFPLRFVDDGVVVRASVAPECACVFNSIGRGGTPFEAALDERIAIDVLPEQIVLADDHQVARGEFCSWLDELAALPGDVVGVLWYAALAARRGALALGEVGPGDPACAEMAQQLTTMSKSLRDELQRRLSREWAWRSERDLVVRAARWIADVITMRLSASDAAAFAGPTGDATGEAFYLRAVCFGRMLDQPVAADLAHRALRVVLARALRDAGPPAADAHDPVFAQPLALVEAMVRGHGLA